MSKQSKDKKLNTHAILSAYRRHPEYPTIARQAAAWARENPGASESDVRAWVETRYGKRTLLQMRSEPVPLTLFGEIDTHIPANAVKQMETVLRLPVARSGSLMPDAHLGYAMPIGGVADLDEAISPSFVGYDISCMVQLSILDISPEAFMTEREGLADVLRNVTSFGLGSDFKRGVRQHAVMEDPRWSDIEAARRLQALAQRQLGSSGGGNHFADLVLIDFIEPLDGLPAKSQHVGLLTHSGSRGAGHKLATYYVKQAQQLNFSIARGVPKGYEWLPIQSGIGAEYFQAMRLMGRYARANHDLIHDHFLAEAGLAQNRRIWNRHNFAWYEESNGSVLHRKGATPADDGLLGLVPGTSGTASYLVRGLGNPDSHYSSSHGAGRWFSRKEAHRRHDAKAFRKHMRSKDILHIGLEADETFMAYKDIEMVMGLQNGVLVEPVARMQPKVVIMGGRSDDGD
jgi:tRNA-splicing ligase RtcB